MDLDTGHPAMVASVLGIVAHTCQYLTADPRDACSLLQVHSTWRDALQHSMTRAAAATTVDLRTDTKLRSFAAWLPKYGSLLAAAKVDGPLWPCSTAGTAAVQLMQDSLAAAAGTGGGLRLQHFSTNYLHNPAVLSLLPAAPLTHLDLSMVLGDEQQTAASASFSSTLASFTNLHRLSLGAAWQGDGLLPLSLLGTLRALPHLRHLDLKGASLSSEAQAQLPPGLHTLTLDAPSFPNGALNLQHMTGLQYLDLAPSEGTTGGSASSTSSSTQGLLCPLASNVAKVVAEAVLPAQLRGLTVLMGRVGRTQLDLTQVPQLCELTIRDSRETPEWLEAAAAACPHLTRLSLTYTHWQSLASSAPVWRQLPQLQHLGLRDIKLRHTWQQELLRLSLAAATSLTSLHICHLHTTAPVAVFEPLTGLSRLVTLYLKGVRVMESDVAHLSALRGLSSLQMLMCGATAAHAALDAVCPAAGGGNGSSNSGSEGLDVELSSISFSSSTSSEAGSRSSSHITSIHTSIGTSNGSSICKGSGSSIGISNGSISSIGTSFDGGSSSTSSNLPVLRQLSLTCLAKSVHELLPRIAANLTGLQRLELARGSAATTGSDKPSSGSGCGSGFGSSSVADGASLAAQMTNLAQLTHLALPGPGPQMGMSPAALQKLQGALPSLGRDTLKVDGWC